MRSRNIKPGIFKNELLGVEDPLLTIIFMGLWCAADRNGVLEDRPLRLKAEILPYREKLDFNRYLTELSRLGFIHRYGLEEKQYIQVINFKKHQRPHHTEKESGLPEYIKNSDSCDLTVSSPLVNGKNPPDSLIPDSLIPDSNKYSEEIKNFSTSYQEYISKEFKNLAPKISDKFLLKCCDTVDKLIRLDGFTFQQVYDCVQWGSKDDFWKGQIKSLANIRKKGNNGESKFNNLYTAFTSNPETKKTKSQIRTQNNANAIRNFINGRK